MKETLDRFFLFIFKISFLSSVGILIIRASNAVSFKITNSYLISWRWLNHLFVDTDPVGSIVVLLALLSGITYLLWLWWDPFLVRLPRQKGSSWLYYDWEEGLEPVPKEEHIASLKKTVISSPLLYPADEGNEIAKVAFRKLKKLDLQEAEKLLLYISENLDRHLKKYPPEVLQDLKKI